MEIYYSNSTGVNFVNFVTALGKTLQMGEIGDGASYKAWTFTENVQLVGLWGYQTT